MMANKKQNFTLTSSDKSSTVQLKNVEYLGSGTYDCELHANSNGFMCQRPFGFDNDEYFLAKLNALLNNGEGEAELMDMSADSFIRFRTINDEQLLLTGYLVEHTQVTHSIEFAFSMTKHDAKKFAVDFEKLVRSCV